MEDTQRQTVEAADNSVAGEQLDTARTEEVVDTVTLVWILQKEDAVLRMVPAFLLFSFFLSSNNPAPHSTLSPYSFT